MLFKVTDFGGPFESVLTAIQTRIGDRTELRFETRLKPLFPWLFAVVLVLTVWPGVWLTDSLLRSYFGWYTWPQWVTWAWYMPLTVPTVPLGMRAALRKSRAAALADAHDLAQKIARHTGGELVPAGVQPEAKGPPSA